MGVYVSRVPAVHSGDVTKRRPPQRQRLPLEIALSNPAVREVEAEYSLDAPSMGDVWQCAAFAGVAAAFAFGLAHWFAVMADIPGYATQTGLAGLVGLMALVGYAYLLHVSRRTRQWATFDRQPGETAKAPEFVPVADSPRTLVLDTRLRGQMIRFAQMLPAADYSLAYRRWVEKERLFTRGEFDKVRAMMAAAQPPLMKGNALTDAGRAAVGRWSVGGLSADEVHALRSPTPAGQMDMHDD